MVNVDDQIIMIESDDRGGTSQTCPPDCFNFRDFKRYWSSLYSGFSPILPLPMTSRVSEKSNSARTDTLRPRESIGISKPGRNRYPAEDGEYRKNEDMPDPILLKPKKHETNQEIGGEGIGKE